MKSRLKYSVLYILISIFFLSCSEDESIPDPTINLVKITEGNVTDANTKIEVWAKEPVFAGYNTLFVRLRDSGNGQIIDKARITLNPMMYMTGGMNHTCPFENPVSETAINGLFPASVFFVMPTSDMGNWKFTVNVENLINSKSGSLEFDITVANPADARMRSFTTPLSEKYFIGYTFPEKVKVGINTLVVTSYQRLSGMEWPAAEDLTFELTPEMPSMDHGSPNNIDPVHTSGALYTGKVNFTMTGLWRLHLKIYKGGELIQETYFDVTVE
jgi:hypothetical protein